MAAAKGISGAAILVAAAALTGAVAVFLPLPAVALLAGALGFFLVAALIHFRSGTGETVSWHPVLMLLTCASVLLVTWNGVPVANTSIADIVLVLALGALGVCWIQGSIRIPLPGWLVAAAGALIAAQLVAAIVVPVPPVDPPPSYTPPASVVVTLAKVELGMLMVPVLIGAVASSWRRIDLIVNLWLVSASISAAIATFDALTGAGIGLSITKVQLAEAPREAGLSLHPNHLALASAMALPVALHHVAYGRGRRRAAGVGATGILLAGIVFSGSRVGLLAGFVAVLLTGLLIARLRGRVLFAGLAAAVVLPAILVFVPGASSFLVGLERLAGGGRASVADQARSEQLEQSLDIALSHPVTGVGFQTIEDAHHVPLQFWEAAGILGVLAFLLYAAGVLRMGWRLFRNRQLPPGAPELAAVLTISFTAWLIGGLYTSILSDRYLYIPVGLLIGMQIASRAPRPKPASPDPTRSEPANAPPPPPSRRSPSRRPTGDHAGAERVPVAG